ncbi:MAG: NAD(P)H-binding protein [Bacteroidetes bacterium]|nr:NAD(P)H-binding protein [Bacteroidota bacterium]
MKKTAIIIGATGLTGSLLLQKLLTDDSYESIKLFSRRSAGIKNAKITEFIGDIVQLEDFKYDFTADEVYCCVGTTKSKTKDKSAYRDIDFGIPTKAAKLAKENSIPFFAVISAIGSDENSSVFYNKTKGEMESAVINEKIESTYILRPSLIKGNRKENRLGENIANLLFSILNIFLVGSLKKYQSINAETIADALFKLPNLKNQNLILESDEIKRIR